MKYVGTGRGYSVLEMVAAMEKACGHKLATKIGQRRAGKTVRSLLYCGEVTSPLVLILHFSTCGNV